MLSRTKWCDFMVDETLDDSSQISYHTPGFTGGNIGAVNPGIHMYLVTIVSFKFITCGGTTCCNAHSFNKLW